MLPRVRSVRLCRGCRYDLLNLFEGGFCSPLQTLQSQPFRSLRQRPFRSQRSIRAYSKTAIRLDKDADLDTTEPAKVLPPSDNLPSNLFTRLEKLAELERRVDEAERRFYDQPVGSEYQEGISDEINADASDPHVPLTPLKARDILIRRAQGFLATLRNSGTSQEDIAREARLIFREILPEDILNESEHKIYTRLYGEPAPEEEEFDEYDGEVTLEQGTMRLFDEHGRLVEMDHHEDDIAEEYAEDEVTNQEAVMPPSKKIDFASDDLPPKLLVSSMERLEEIARSVNGEVMEDDSAAYEEENLERSNARLHPYTRLGKFANNPGNILLPKDRFVAPVEGIMTRYSNKHLKDVCERTFGGPGLPNSPLTPRSGRTKEQVPIPLTAADHNMGEMEANAFITTVMPPTYASIMSVLVETRKRLGPTWINNLLAKEGGPRVLDVGSGGAGVLAWREFIQAHWETLHTSDKEPPPPPDTKSVVLTGSHTLRHRAAELLDNTTFIPRLPDYVHLREGATLEDDRESVQRKQFDVIIASHSLFGLKEDYMKKEMVQNLWSMLSSDSGVIIIIEKGIPRGFEAVAGARDLILEKYISIPEGRKTYYSDTQDFDAIATRKPGMIIAPCTNHEQCPMYLVPGKSHGRKDWCGFQQRYTRPSYLQRVLGAKDRNHDDVDFSYISVMKGDDLRNRKIQSWEGLEDALSAPSVPGAQGQSVQGQAWIRQTQIGFEEVEPNTTLEDFNTTDENRDSLESLPAPWNLPRLVLPALKRKQHIIMDVCTPHGRIERWTVPKSFGKQAYHDARKTQWGDLWALGAKTRIDRRVRAGQTDNREAVKARRREQAMEDAEDILEGLEEEELDGIADLQEIEEELMAEYECVDRKKREKSTDPRSRKREAYRLKKEHKSQAKQRAPAGNSETFSFGMDEDAARDIDPTIRSSFSQKVSKSNTASGSTPRQRLQGLRSHVRSSENNREGSLTSDEQVFLEEWSNEFDTKVTKMKGPKERRAFNKFGNRGKSPQEMSIRGFARP